MPAKARSALVDSVFGRAVVLGLAYWLAVTLAIELVFPVEKIALFWPPNAIAAAALILGDRKHWPLYLVVTALAYLAGRIPSDHFPLYVYFGFCAANLIEVSVVAALVRRFIPDPVSHDSLTTVLPAVMLASIPATVMSAFIAGAFVVSAIEAATFLGASVGWFVSDLSGMLLVLPVLLAWLSPGAPSVRHYDKYEIIERTGIVAILVAIGLAIPVYIPEQPEASLVFPYLVFPVLIWTAIRAGIRSVTLATLAVGLFAVFLTYLGQGPFSFEGVSASGQVVLMNAGLITIAATTVFLAIVVAERKGAVEALEESQERFRDYARTSSDYFFEMDENLRFSYFSERFTEIAGISPHELLGKTREETGIPDVDEAEWRRHLADLQAHRPFRNFIHPRTHPDGRVVYLSINGVPVFDADGTFMGYRCTGADITERRRAEERTRNLIDAIKNLQEGIAFYDDDDNLVFCNDEYRRLRPAIKDLLVPGANFESLLRADVESGGILEARGREEAYIKERMDEFHHPKEPFSRQLASGTWYFIKEGRTLDGGTYSTSMDVTALKQAEEDLRRALIDAEQANQAKSEFLAIVSHEFRTPLNAIVGFSEILGHQRFGSFGVEKFREYAGDIHASSQHLTTLVNDILDISAIEAGGYSMTKSNFAIKDVIRDCARIVVDSASRKDIEFLTKVPDDLPPLNADKRAVKQILLNLLSNAVKFTAKGGKVVLSAKASKTQLSIVVSDTGRGVPAEELTTITDPFVRVDADPYLTQSGTGLGLTITKSLVELQGGTLDIESTPGEGTTVTVTLPNGAP